MSDIQLPTLLVTSDKSSFRLRVLAAAWSSECGAAGRYGSTRDGLVLLSAVGPDTAVKGIRATLYSPDIAAEFTLEGDSTERLTRAAFADKPVAWQASVAKLASGAVHLVAVARIPGMMSNIGDAHLFAELNSPRYSTPLLRSWVGWLKRSMIENGQIVMCDGYESTAGILQIESDELDELISRGVRSGYLKVVA
jgi:hypothetical protein